MDARTKTLRAPVLQTILIDLTALSFILLMPALSHLSGIPFYFLEPMRLMLVVALLFSSRYNAFALAVVLPLFSFLVSGHPEPVKMLIIIAELALNVWIFLALIKSTKKPFLSMLGAILLSKLFCYSLYLVVFSWAFVVNESAPVFLGAQVAVTVGLSAITMVILKTQCRDA